MRELNEKLDSPLFNDYLTDHQFKIHLTLSPLTIEQMPTSLTHCFRARCREYIGYFEWTDWKRVEQQREQQEKKLRFYTDGAQPHDGTADQFHVAGLAVFHHDDQYCYMGQIQETNKTMKYLERDATSNTAEIYAAIIALMAAAKKLRTMPKEEAKKYTVEVICDSKVTIQVCRKVQAIAYKDINKRLHETGFSSKFIGTRGNWNIIAIRAAILEITDLSKEAPSFTKVRAHAAKPDQNEKGNHGADILASSAIKGIWHRPTFKMHLDLAELACPFHQTSICHYDVGRTNDIQKAVAKQ